MVAEVDGEQRTITVSPNRRSDYVLATGLPEGDHTVLLRRDTMAESAAQGMFVDAEALLFNGTLLSRPADNLCKVAFIGDSITCGSGLASAPSGLLTYAVDFADRENVDYDICSISGIGVYRSTQKHGYTSNNMAKYYQYFN